MISEMLYSDVKNNGYEITKCSYEGSFVITGNKPKISERFFLHQINRVRRKINKIKFWMNFEKEIKKLDALVIGGGNMIMDLTPDTKAAMHFNRYISIAKKHNKKVVVLSVGIGPFQTMNQQNKAIEALESCDFVTYRDESSYLLGAGNKKDQQYISVDPVFMLPKQLVNGPETKQQVIGIGVIDTLLFDPSMERYSNTLNGYVNLINRLIELDYDIVVFSTEIADYNMVNDVVNECNNNRVSIKYVENSDELLELYSNLSALVAARMHSLIIAYTQQIPIIGISWQQKVSSMFKLIDSDELCFEITELSEQVEDIVNQVKYSVNNENLRLKNEVKLQEFKKKYDINSYILNEIKKGNK
ncbi:hypothetical protein LQ50_22315 [Halalkalibacter okhensis]|uniref:Polysaccharide pyruvyl transferase domain-containing protein n=2 Tax=Halalkalibacter okhensis TaxID=333138 RepID=A0A0B0IAG5_9BACI|nr:hypothetical protein LQ50_22315 [Halalkalibacter okhensis]